MVDYHLVVLVHGLWGHSSHMNYLKSQIEEVIGPNSSGSKIVVYTTGSHSGFLTYDGIDVNGKRICDEIVIETDRLQSEKDSVIKFSIVGYSLGGLISRYAIGYLKSIGYFEDIEPVNFTTFCTPHVGVLNPGTSWGTRLYNYCTPFLLAHTGSQLFLTDKKKDRLPLLLWMSDSRSIFYQALSGFQNLSLYANVINDKRTSWYTAAISSRDPFRSMINENASAYVLKFIDNYEPNVVDISTAIEFKSDLDDNIDRSRFNRGKKSLVRKFRWVKVIVSAIFVTPLYLVYLIGLTVVEIFNNQRRVGKFFKDASNSMVHLYEAVDEMITEPDDTEAQRISRDTGPRGDQVQETGSFVSQHYEDKTIFNKVQDDTDTLVESVFTAMNSDSYKNYHDTTSRQPQKTEQLNLVNMKGAVQDFNLNLTPDQLTLIGNLNKLNWCKFPVLIRDTKQTHRAAIYRMDDPALAEGKVIVRHFVQEIFKS